MMPANARTESASEIPDQPHAHPRVGQVDPLSQGVHSATFTSQQSPYGPMAAGHTVRAVPLSYTWVNSSLTLKTPLKCLMIRSSLDASLVLYLPLNGWVIGLKRGLPAWSECSK